ncbi:MAG: nicotinamide riboside transporter PnuC [Puniceicoccales bacterium]
MGILSDISFNQAVEILTVALSLLYVGLIAFNRRSGWWFGIAASILSVWLFIRVNLLAESILYVYYVGMGLYGYFHWKYTAALDSNPRIQTRSIRFHLGTIAISVCLILGLAQVLSLINSSNIYADASTTVFSFVATWMVAQRILENWLYWVAIDAFSVWLYNSRELPVYAALMAFYSLIAIVGFFLWFREYRGQTPENG